MKTQQQGPSMSSHLLWPAWNSPSQRKHTLHRNLDTNLNLLWYLTMIKQLPEWWWWAGSSRLFSIDCVQCLIHKLAKDSEEIDPLWHSHGKAEVIIHVSQRSNDINHQPCECDQVWRNILNHYFYLNKLPLGSAWRKIPTSDWRSCPGTNSRQTRTYSFWGFLIPPR